MGIFTRLPPFISQILDCEKQVKNIGVATCNELVSLSTNCMNEMKKFLSKFSAYRY